MLLAERIQAIARLTGLPVRTGLPGRYNAASKMPATAGWQPAKKESQGVIPTGWLDIDNILYGGLPAGALHEWFGIAPSNTSQTGRYDRGRWMPPLAPLVHIAWQFLQTAATPTRIVWIGERCFPYPRVLVRDHGNDRRLLECSIFVSPRDANDRLWAVDLSLRSPVVGLVIADGSRFGMAATRRLQLVAKSQATPVFVIRPPWETVELSAAQTRWLLCWQAPLSRITDSPRIAPQGGLPHPRWTLELLRCKGLASHSWLQAQTPLRGACSLANETRLTGLARPTWVVEWNRATCTLDLSTSLVHQNGTPQAVGQGETGASPLGDSLYRSA